MRTLRNLTLAFTLACAGAGCARAPEAKAPKAEAAQVDRGDTRDDAKAREALKKEAEKSVKIEKMQGFTDKMEQAADPAALQQAEKWLNDIGLKLDTSTSSGSSPGKKQGQDTPASQTPPARQNSSPKLPVPGQR